MGLVIGLVVLMIVCAYFSIKEAPRANEIMEQFIQEMEEIRKNKTIE